MPALEYKMFQMNDGSTYKGYVLKDTLTPNGISEIDGPTLKYTFRCDQLVVKSCVDLRVQLNPVVFDRSMLRFCLMVGKFWCGYGLYVYEGIY